MKLEKTGKASYIYEVGNYKYQIYATQVGSPAVLFWRVDMWDQNHLAKGSWERTTLKDFASLNEAIIGSKHHATESKVDFVGVYKVTKNPKHKNVGEVLYIPRDHSSVPHAIANSQLFTCEDQKRGYVLSYLGSGEKFLKIPLPLVNTCKYQD